MGFCEVHSLGDIPSTTYLWKLQIFKDQYAAVLICLVIYLVIVIDNCIIKKYLTCEFTESGKSFM